MLKKIVYCTALLSAAALLPAQNSDSGNDFPWKLNITPSATIRSGEQMEYVYMNNVNGDKARLSKIEWDENPVIFFGADLAAGYRNFYINGGAKIALPSDTGDMCDSDWQNIKDLAPGDQYYDAQTDFSTHTNRLNFYYALNAGLSYDFKFNLKNTPVHLQPFAQFEYEYSDFKACDGTGIYGYVSSEDSPKHPYTEYAPYGRKQDYSGYDVIQLERIVYKTWLGFSAEIEMPRGFNAGLSLAVLPFVYAQSLDSHLFSNYSSYPNRYYLDTLHDFLKGFKVSAKLEKECTPHHFIFIKASFEIIPEFNGTSAVSENERNGVYAVSSDTSGASFSWFEFSAGYTFKL